MAQHTYTSGVVGIGIAGIVVAEALHMCTVVVAVVVEVDTSRTVGDRVVQTGEEFSFALELAVLGVRTNNFPFL